MKKFWRIVIIVAILVIVLMVFNRCKTQTVVVDEKPQTPQIEETSKKIPWTLSFQKKLGLLVKGVSLYNNTEIKLDGEFFTQKFFVNDDGSVRLADTVCYVLKTVPKETQGKLKPKEGLISNNPLLVIFSYSDATFEFKFLLKDSVYTLDKTEATLFFKNKPYKVKPTTDKNKECILVFDYTHDRVKIEVKENAEGVPPEKIKQ